MSLKLEVRSLNDHFLTNLQLTCLRDVPGFDFSGIQRLYRDRDNTMSLKAYVRSQRLSRVSWVCSVHCARTQEAREWLAAVEAAKLQLHSAQTAGGGKSPEVWASEACDWGPNLVARLGHGASSVCAHLPTSCAVSLLYAVLAMYHRTFHPD